MKQSTINTGCSSRNLPNSVYDWIQKVKAAEPSKHFDIRVETDEPLTTERIWKMSGIKTKNQPTHIKKIELLDS